METKKKKEDRCRRGNVVVSKWLVSSSQSSWVIYWHCVGLSGNVVTLGEQSLVWSEQTNYPPASVAYPAGQVVWSLYHPPFFRWFFHWWGGCPWGPTRETNLARDLSLPLSDKFASLDVWIPRTLASCLLISSILRFLVRQYISTWQCILSWRLWMKSDLKPNSSNPGVLQPWKYAAFWQSVVLLGSFLPPVNNGKSTNGGRGRASTPRVFFP